MGLDLLRQCPLYCRAGCIRGMHDAAVAVAAFACQVQLLGMQLVMAELDALLDQPFDRRFAMFDHETGSLFAAQSGAGNEGILNMGLERIVIAQHCRDAALSPAAGAIEQGFFGDESDFFMFGQMQGQRHARQPAADDHYVKIFHVGSRQDSGG